jgi:hypothetical protein
VAFGRVAVIDGPKRRVTGQSATRARSNRLSRSGSASTSIEPTQPPATVTDTTANGRPSGAQVTPPGIPLTRARVAVSARRRNDSALGARAAAPRTTDSAAYWFLMQIGMVAGFLTSWPANVWLINRGIKVPM